MDVSPQPDVPCEIRVVEYPDGVAVVECMGEHDLATRDELASLLKDLLAHHELVVVDVSETAFIDSSFVNNLFIANGFASRAGKRFRLQHSTAPIVHAVLEISGLLEKLDCATNREEAVN